MNAFLIDSVKEKIKISDKEVENLTSSFHKTTKKKNEFLVNEGYSSWYLYFLVEGYIRCFHNHEGNEITTQIYTKGSLVTSFESFTNNKLSKENIQCNSDCTLLRISKSDYEKLYTKVINWSVFCKGVYEDYIVKISDRAKSFQNLSATERYLKLLKTQPNIIQNTTVKHLASYLGIKPQSLSRIRQEIIK